MTIPFQYNDGGRAAAGFQGQAGDCAVRAVSIALRRDYREVFDELNQHAREFERDWDQPGEFFPSSSDGGYWPVALTAYLAKHGWERVDAPTEMSERLHLNAKELPSGSIITQLRGQYAAVVDGVVHSTNDCRDEYFVYGYWRRAE